MELGEEENQVSFLFFDELMFRWEPRRLISYNRKRLEEVGVSSLQSERDMVDLLYSIGEVYEGHFGITSMRDDNATQ